MRSKAYKWGSSLSAICGAAFSQCSISQIANDNIGKPIPAMTVVHYLQKSGIKVKFRIPVAEFSGVAVITTISLSGDVTSALDLVHPNPDFTCRLYEESGNTHILANWHSWSKKLQLPLFVKAGDGSLKPFAKYLGDMANMPYTNNPPTNKHAYKYLKPIK